MGYCLSSGGMEEVFQQWKKEYTIFAPKVFRGGGKFSDTDCIRYGEIQSIMELVLDRKSEYSFKEVLLPISQTLFYFTENTVKEADAPNKGAIVFLRSCDLHAMKRLDQMYLKNGVEDFYYKRLREKVKFVLIGCSQAFDRCFCVDMGTNQSTDYDLSIEAEGEDFLLDCKYEAWDDLFQRRAKQEEQVIPSYVTTTKVRVTIPEILDQEILHSKLWEEYDSRCINCGRCNFVCPTCTCFTMQDLFYDTDKKVGERRRVWASCMVDGYTEVAGGGSYRQKNGQRMRFKVLHKILDYKKRNGYHMCIGCGRCDEVCPEYISFSHCINRLEQSSKEVAKQDAE